MNTDELLTHARSRFDHVASNRILKEKYQAKLTFAHAGGLWLAGPELLAALSACTGPTSVLLDLYDTPVQVAPNEFRDLVRSHWQEQMNAWLIEHQALNQNR
jgi:glyoxylase-like metal-dependent hydrolase (beta-lactamase superfamily II)